jgi:mRNA interferase MazF
MTCERGDLLLIPYPFSDHSASKRRPVVALTARDGYGDFVAMPVTSRPQAEHGFALAPDDLVSGTLPLASWIRADRIITLNSRLIVKRFGRVSDRVILAVVEHFCAHIGHPASL